ncbi:MAG: glucose-6-phosphate isomerase [Gammaproteobacteria bacterium]
MNFKSITDSPAWQALSASQQRNDSAHMLDWFASDPDRVKRMTVSEGELSLDFSKQLIDEQTLSELGALADEAELGEAVIAMFNGTKLNSSENRAVLHVALRGSVDAELEVDGQNVATAVETELARMLEAAEQIRAGKWIGFGGKAITDVVHIGIGGSDLGPRMVTRALTPFHDSNASVHFVSNIDAHELLHVLETVSPETTLFLIASKSFGTEETLCNARIAREFIVDHFDNSKAVARHMLALSSNPERVVDFGIDPANRFEFWDWVGGRYSVWSVIGMPIAIAIGADGFRQFLDGARRMDEHFKTASWTANIPVMLALTGIWNRNFMGFASQAVVPYAHFLDLLPQYLQQAEMESNGKRVRVDGTLLETPSSPVVWGTAGTDSQHAYFQMLHQGTEAIPVDFVVAVRSRHNRQDSHQRLLTHAIAQSEALLCGKSADSAPDKLKEHQRCPGNRPSTTWLLEELTPAALGMVIAAFEHKIFVIGRVLGINSFDQFGVELGKQLASELLPMMRGEAPLSERDASTLALLRRCRTNDSAES